MKIDLLINKHSLEDLIKDLEFGYEMRESRLKYVPLPNYYGYLCELHGLTATQMKYNVAAYDLIREQQK